MLSCSNRTKIDACVRWRLSRARSTGQIVLQDSAQQTLLAWRLYSCPITTLCPVHASPNCCDNCTETIDVADAAPAAPCCLDVAESAVCLGAWKQPIASDSSLNLLCRLLRDSHAATVPILPPSWPLLPSSSRRPAWAQFMLGTIRDVRRHRPCRRDQTHYARTSNAEGRRRG